ncbi:MAG TPA: hypothetical protein VND64_37240 [Pirellulales bacterium]|nr:hypothetical protein [Pirellulales bacterium]
MSPRTRTILWIVAAAACCASSNIAAFAAGDSPTMTLPQPADTPATLSFEQIRNAIRARHATIKAMEVEYEFTTDVQYRDPMLREPVPRIVQHFAFKGEKRFSSLSAPPRGDVNGPLAVDLALTFDGAVAQRYFPRGGEGSLDTHKEMSIDADNYVAMLAIPLTDSQRSLASESDEFLPFALDRAEAEWRVAPNLEIVDGARCHVLVSKHRQRIWVDPSIGFAMRFRELHQRVGGRPVDQWPLMSREAFRAYRDVQDEIWLPQRVETIDFVSARAPENLWNRELARKLLTVTKLAVNEQVADSLFKLSFPTGTLVNDHVHHRAYRIGNANEEIELLASDAERVLPDQVPRRRWIFIALNVVAVIVAAAVILWHHLKQTKRAQP